ncbi:TerB family tellurite resistance protein [Acetobacteraceae bacterium H6797]|nr:TerB family tellurite resistance protein [Acetobacteraceae bacterium H6797]
MNIWGKILGGVAGFAVGGPFGAMIGAALGHAADEGAIQAGMTKRRHHLPSDPADLASYLGSRDQLFAISVIVLSAKLAKCDGAVKRSEIDAFKRVFRIPPENLREVGELFDEARHSHEGFEPFADRLGEAFLQQREVLEEVLNALFAIARADAPLNRAETAFLGAVHLRFGLSTAAWERARGAAHYAGPGGGAQGAGQGTYGSNGTPSQAGAQPDPYAVLGLSANASDAEVRATWRRLMRENHPDTMAAKGVSADLIKRASAKVAEINAAWDRIKRSRGL